MVIVLDTNVLVSGLISSHGPPAIILDRILSKEICIAYDTRILSEYEEVLSRPKFSIKFEEMDAILEDLESSGIEVFPPPLPQTLPDPSDQKFLEVALASEAQALITGNLKDFPPKLRHGVLVQNPRSFMDTLRKNFLN